MPESTGSGKRSEFALLTRGTLAQQLSTAAVQVAVGLLMTVVVRVGRGNLVVAVALTLGVLAVAGVSAVSVWDMGSPVEKERADS